MTLPELQEIIQRLEKFEMEGNKDNRHDLLSALTHLWYVRDRLRETKDQTQPDMLTTSEQQLLHQVRQELEELANIEASQP